MVVSCITCSASFEKGVTGSEGNRCPECTRARNRERYNDSKGKDKVPVERICSSCGESFINGSAGSFRGICAKCKLSYRIQRYDNNKDKVLSINKECFKLHKAAYVSHKKQYREEHKEELSARNHIRYIANREAILAKNNKRKVARLRVDPWMRIRENLASTMRKAMQQYGAGKISDTMSLLGCDIGYFVKHIESQFTKGMSWSNYGKNGWVIDHIIPCASFNLEIEDEAKRCFNYRNLRPLWEVENHIKLDKMPDGILGRYLRTNSSINSSARI